ncbi:hypothetical protein K438DRAFT_1676974 [Mycena galopus ATCC 62051]|nr:hypothetical protein K438DRAFT_1676974 [Mycena galopus ATCC 62051]
MPVTFTVASHSANQFAGMGPGDGLSPRMLLVALGPDNGEPSPYANVGEIRGTSFSRDEENLKVSSPAERLSLSLKAQTKSKLSRLSALFARKKRDVCETTTPAIQASPISPPPDDGSEILIKNVFPRPNGFVDTIISAYNQHHAVILRPDDVWIAILTQFNFYVNANAELLRANFVAHEGKKSLVLRTPAFDDFGRLAREMVGLIEENVVDPSLRAWALPDFSTTTLNDTTVGSIVLMATLKYFFEYVYCDVCCGIPRVTLEGERADWEKILQRLEKLKEFGLETIAWYHLLAPVISRFVKAFDNPQGKSNVDFWQSVAHFERGGSGPSYYSGWITAFCAFNDKGEWLGPRFKANVDSPIAPESLTAEKFWKTYGGYAQGLMLDGTRFHKVDCANIPPSYVEVDVRLVSFTGEQQECSMTAGVVGTRVCSSNDSDLSPSGRDDTIRPVIGWWLFNKN